MKGNEIVITFDFSHVEIVQALSDYVFKEQEIDLSKMNCRFTSDINSGPDEPYGSLIAIPCSNNEAETNS